VSEHVAGDEGQALLWGSLNQTNNNDMETNTGAENPSGKPAGADKKIIAGICGIVLGGLGIHKFILGYTKQGIIQIVLSLITCGAASIIGLIEGIIYLTKSDEEFVKTYIQNKRGWF
jgi:TM2 domain-containing membrane protein YozV